MGLGRDLASKAARLAFTACMALIWCGADRLGAADPPQPPSSQISLVQLADVLHKQAKICADLDRDLPHDTFAPKAIVEKVGKDPQALFAWMRDNTAFVPYQGTLRGALGVLMDRQGNSLDRALLLARLLQLSGQKVRLTHGMLDRQKAEDLLRSAWDDPASAPPAAEKQEADDDAAVTTFAASEGLDPAQVRQDRDQWKMAMQARNEDLVGTSTEQSAALSQLIGTPAIATEDARNQQISDISDHWWVQVAQDSGWTDLDPATRSAKAGDRLAEPSATVDLPADGQLPSDRSIKRHEVELRVRVERSGDGKPVTEVPFKYVLPLAETGASPIKLIMDPADWPSDLDLTGAPDVAIPRLKAALLAQEHWVPVLQIGDKTIIQGEFDGHGVVDPHASLDSISKSGKSTKSAAQSAFDAFGGGPAAPSTDLTAVWLEYEIRSPGRPPRTITRDLFDARGPAARLSNSGVPAFDDALRLKRAALLDRAFDVMAAGFVPSHPYIEHLVFRNVLANEPIMEKALRESQAKPPAAVMKDLSGLTALPGGLLALAAARRGPTGSGADFALDRPNIFAISNGLAVDSAGNPIARMAIDIVANEATLRGIAAKDLFQRRLAQGVLETAMERYAIGHPDPSYNTTAIFAASASQKVDWVKLAGRDDPKLARLTLHPDALARIKGELADGYTVVAPVAPVGVAGSSREGWWRIDPRDGSCVGVGADGTGTDMVETTILVGFIFLEVAMELHCMAESKGSGLGCMICAMIGIAGDLFSFGSVSAMAAVGIGAAGSSVGAVCEHLAG